MGQKENNFDKKSKEPEVLARKTDAETTIGI